MSCVVRKTRDNTDLVDLRENLKGIDVTRVSLGGISAVGRTKVDKNVCMVSK